MGKLKPDLNTEELVEKRMNAQRVKLFAKNLNVINREQLAHQRSLERAAETPPSKFEKAKEYAASVPLPRVSVSDSKRGRGGGGGGGRGGGGGGVGKGGRGGERGRESVGLNPRERLEELESVHDERQRQAAMIRSELGLDL